MDLKTLHLEELVVLPKDYRKILTERPKFTTELHEAGFSTYGDSIDYWYVWVEELFYITILGEEEDLYYLKIRDIYRNGCFKPFFRYLKQWAKDNKIKKTNPYYHFAEWLKKNYLKGYKKGSLYVTLFRDDEITFQAESEEILFRALKEISTGIRLLATEHASEPLDMITEFEYDEADLKGKDYWKISNNILTPMLLKGLIEGISIFRQKVESKEIDETIISIKLNKKDKSMLFYYGDECEGETFFEFGIGKVLTRCVSLIKENDLIYTQELSDWFTDAISGIPEHIYEDLELTIEVPETDGDPYL